MCWKGKAVRYLWLQRGPTIFHFLFLFFFSFSFLLPKGSEVGQRYSSLIHARRISTEQSSCETELCCIRFTAIWFMLAPNYPLNIMLNNGDYHFQSIIYRANGHHSPNYCIQNLYVRSIYIHRIHVITCLNRGFLVPKSHQKLPTKKQNTWKCWLLLHII